jgi:hypothetical protein
MQLYLKVAVVAGDAAQRVADLFFGAFEPLKIDVGPADQRAGDTVALVQAAGLVEDAVQNPGIKAEGARCRWPGTGSWCRLF